MSFVDPNQFIITRKRKKYKFALFHNSPLCFEFDEWIKREVDCLEIGAGTGLFSVELALRHPEKTFLAIDVKGDRLLQNFDREGVLLATLPTPTSITRR
jgi:tRNA (guanine-N7-)-methyltransferase